MPPLVFPLRRAPFERFRLLLLCDALFRFELLLRAGRDEPQLAMSVSSSCSTSSLFFIPISLAHVPTFHSLCTWQPGSNT